MEVSNLLKCQFIVWAWDITQDQNKQNLFEWMNLSNMSSVAESIRMIPTVKYPLLVILVKERGTIMRANVIMGLFNFFIIVFLTSKIAKLNQ